MRIELDGKPFTGSGTNTLENVQGGVRQAAGECAAAMGRMPGARMVVTDIAGYPGLVFVAEYPAPAAAKPPRAARAAKPGDTAPAEEGTA